jgi:hypothetical protein
MNRPFPIVAVRRPFFTRGFEHPDNPVDGLRAG